MANYNIDDLTAIGSLSDSDLIEVLSGGVNFKGTVGQLKTALGTGLTDWSMDTNAFPSGSKKGQRYYGVITVSTTLLDTSGNPLPSKIIATALQDSASTSNPSQWAFTYTIN